MQPRTVLMDAWACEKTQKGGWGYISRRKLSRLLKLPLQGISGLLHHTSCH